MSDTAQLDRIEKSIEKLRIQQERALKYYLRGKGDEDEEKVPCDWCGNTYYQGEALPYEGALHCPSCHAERLEAE